MKKIFVNYIFYSVTLFLVSITSVFALNVDNSKDLITATDTSSGFFYVNNSQDYNTASRFKDTGGIEETVNKKAMTSVKNGTYYVWHYSTSGVRSDPVKVHVSNSCDNELKTKQTGTFTMERCYIKTSSSVTEEVPLGSNVNFCANGYKVTAGNIIGDTCTNLSLNGLSKRYCKRVYEFTCTQTATTPETPPPTPDPTPEPTVPAATLSALSIDAASLSPAFSAGTYKYKATVESNVSSIKVSATASSGNTLVKGAGSRTVNLNYGSNTVNVKVKNSAGKVTTYKITVTRKDDRSTVNTLSNITISAGTLSPAFSSDKTSYSVEVPNEVSSISIDATLTDSKSKFASGFGPRSVPLTEGTNQIYLKVTNEKDVTKVYTITVNRGSVPSGCSLQEGELALLKGIEVQASETNPIKIEDFDPLKFDYVGITVPYDIKNLTILPLVQDEGDTYVIDGANDLEVNIDREIVITVTSKACPAYSSIYKLIVTRLPQVEAGTTADLKSLTIKNHSEFKFQKNVLDYNLTLKKGEKKLDISYKPEEKTTKCNVHDNDNLSYGDVVTIECNTPDDIDKVTYKITIDGVEKGTNPVLVILLVIIIIIVLILLIMRMLGYKIYFNMEALKAAFRGMGEKARNTFDK
jgi:hypothetical protein